MYYKIVYNEMIIDVIHDPVWVIWLKRSKRFLMTDPCTANGVVYPNGNGVYNIKDKGLFEGYTEEYKTVSVVEIPEAEYQELTSQITSGTDKPIENHEPTELELLHQKVDELEQYTMGVSIQSEGLAEELKAAKILLGVE